MYFYIKIMSFIRQLTRVSKSRYVYTGQGRARQAGRVWVCAWACGMLHVAYAGIGTNTIIVH